MGKQYISTASASDAHKLDILGLSVTDRYTITVSSDGYANFWDNKKYELQEPNEVVVKQFVNKMGVHHVVAYESILPASHVKIVLIAFASFDGSISFKYFINDELSSLTDAEIPFGVNSANWSPCFYKDPESKQDYFIVTQANGSALVYYLNIESSKDSADIGIKLEKFGDLNNANSSLFPNSVAVSPGVDKKVAVGYTNGDVLLYDLTTLKPIYTFRSTDLQVSNKSTSASSIPRVLAFSPGGSLLAVARDNQSAGSITLYDVKYGENVGSLTTPSHSSKTTIGGFAHDGWIMGLSFDESGEILASCAFDNCVRIWNIETREREATINISPSDLEGTNGNELDNSIASGVQFIKKGIRAGANGDSNEGLCVVSFDRAVRWYREAGGI